MAERDFLILDLQRIKYLLIKQFIFSLIFYKPDFNNERKYIIKVE